MISSEVIVRSWWNLPSFFVGEYPPSLGIVALKSRCHMPLDCGTQGKNSRARYGTLMGKSSVNGDSNGKIICKSHLDGVETSIVLPVVPWNSMLMNQIGSCFRWVEMTNHLQYIFHEKKTPCFPDSFGVWKRGQPPPRWPLNRENEYNQLVLGIFYSFSYGLQRQQTYSPLQIHRNPEFKHQFI